MVAIERKALVERIEAALRRQPICVLLGPRQCGKTTVARQLAQRRKAHWFDLETAAGMRALENPEQALSELEGLVVIDEAQRRPELFAALRPLADRPAGSSRFLLLGSVSPELVRGVAESLAGRAHYLEMSGFSLAEIGEKNLRRLWLRGGYPRAYLTHSADDSVQWREDLMRSVVERDLPLAGVRIAPAALTRFWQMVAHVHGQLWNGSELARSLGVTEPVVRRYLELLCGAFVLRALPPWFENIAKRQYKSPKVYVRDSGLFHALLGVVTQQDLLGRPQLGFSWDGFVVESLIQAAPGSQPFFWRTQGGAELDLLLIRRGKRVGFELKEGDAPGMTKSLHSALADLSLSRAYIVYPGPNRYRVHEKVEVLPLADALRIAAEL